MTRVEPPLSSHPLRRNLIFGDIFYLDKINQEKTTLYIREYRTFDVVLVLVKLGSLANFLQLWEGVKTTGFFSGKILNQCPQHLGPKE